MNTVFQFSVGAALEQINEECRLWEKEKRLEKLWAGDASLWTNADEAQWLGWLNVSTMELTDVSRIEALSAEINTKGYAHIVVLGMGGSSLCPDMMAKTFGEIGNYPRLHVLDSTDPMQIRHLEDSIDLKKTFFIVSSKSGTTLEPNIFKEYFYTRLQTVLGKSDVGDNFLAITDPGTKLEAIAKEDKFREIFYGVPSIGGRYSALSNFGMVPSGLMGINVKEFLSYADKMAEACSPTVAPNDNPGLLLGIILGICAKRGKDKVTLIASPDIQALGAWLEQLLAESTGKLGKGLIPIDQEPVGDPASYGKDRVFVYIRLDDFPDQAQDKEVQVLEQAGEVVIRLNLPNKTQLAGELFRWEMATAVAGSIIGINPFNQPDVEGSKKLAYKIVTEYEKTHKIAKPNLLFSKGELQLFTDEKNAQEITENMKGSPSIEMYLKAHLNRIKQGDYVNISAFIEMSDKHTALLQRCRSLIREEKKVATCLGFGPRFLHSTGQDYKGGPNTGVFLQITADHADDIAIPGANYTFGLVIDAQAEGDFEVLAERSRRVLRVHLGYNVAAGLQQLHAYLDIALRKKQDES